MINNLNIFRQTSFLYPFRWFITAAATLIGWMSYSDITGNRMLSFNSQQQWNAGGPGSHK